MRRLKLNILLLFAISQTAVLAQTNNKIDSIIEKLSWRSVSMTCMATMLMLTHEDSSEIELVKIGKPASEGLIAALSDKNKTVAAHIILTEIWSDTIDKKYFVTKYIHKDCNQLIGWYHIYNGLVWEWYSGIGDSIRQTEIDKIKNYWTQRVIENQNVSIDYSQINSDLRKKDELNYPCNKVYDNNSADIKYSTLYQLLGKNSNDPVFKKLWNKFGNDSTMRFFDDCYFITYGPEGLSFKFGKDSLLFIIFIEDSYKGELPFNLKITDNRKVIEKKIGLPNETCTAYDNTWSYYRNKDLYYYFDKKGKVLELYVSKD